MPSLETCQSLPRIVCIYFTRISDERSGIENSVNEFIVWLYESEFVLRIAWIIHCVVREERVNERHISWLFCSQALPTHRWCLRSAHCLLLSALCIPLSRSATVCSNQLRGQHRHHDPSHHCHHVLRQWYFLLNWWRHFNANLPILRQNALLLNFSTIEIYNEVYNHRIIKQGGHWSLTILFQYEASSIEFFWLKSDWNRYANCLQRC